MSCSFDVLKISGLEPKLAHLTQSSLLFTTTQYVPCQLVGLVDEKPIRFMAKKQFLDLMGPNKNYDKLLVQIQKRTYFTCSRTLNSDVLSFSLVAEINDIKDGDSIGKAIQFMASALSYQNSVRPIFKETLQKLNQLSSDFKKKVGQMCRSRVLPYDNSQQKKIMSSVSKEFLNRVWMYERLSKFYADINLGKPFQFNRVLTFAMPSLKSSENLIQPYHSLFIFKNITIRSIGRFMTQRLKQFLDLIDIQKSLVDVQAESCFSMEQILSMASHLIQNYNCLAMNPFNGFSVFTVNQHVKISKFLKTEQKYTEMSHVSLLRLIQSKFNGYCSPFKDPQIDQKTLRLLIGNRIIKEVYHFLTPLSVSEQPTFPLAQRILRLLQDSQGMQLVELSYRLDEPSDRIFNEACSGSNRWWRMVKC